MVDRDVHLGLADGVHPGRQVYEGLLQPGIIGVGHPQGRRYVGWPEGYDVNAVNGGDFLYFVQPALVFGHDDEENLLVGGLHVFRPRHPAVARGACAARAAALADGRVADGGDGPPCALDTLDVRHLDALGARVQNPQDGLGVVLRHPDDGGHAAQVGYADHLANGLHVEGRMLHVNERAIEPCCCNDFHHRGVSKPDMADDSQSAFPHDALDSVFFHGNPPLSQ